MLLFKSVKGLKSTTEKIRTIPDEKGIETNCFEQVRISYHSLIPCGDLSLKPPVISGIDKLIALSYNSLGVWREK